MLRTTGSAFGSQSNGLTRSVRLVDLHEVRARRRRAEERNRQDSSERLLIGVDRMINAVAGELGVQVLDQAGSDTIPFPVEEARLRTTFFSSRSAKHLGPIASIWKGGHAIHGIHRRKCA